MPISTLIHFLNAYMWSLISLLVFILTLINPHPLAFQHDATFSEMILVFSRRLMLVSMLFLMVLLPAGLGLLYSIHNDITIVIHWYVGLAAHYWRLALAAVLAGFLVKLLTVRYVLPKLSNLKRLYRVELTQDKLSDIRFEKEKYTKKMFNPVGYYKTDHIFLGLDGSEKPVYVSVEDWLETNMQIIGPTRFGKGILMGVQIDQAIRNGYCVMYIDPKGDKNIPRIMENRARELNRKFIYCDLNDQENDQEKLKKQADQKIQENQKNVKNPKESGWHPFMGGNERAKRARILMAFGLENTGNESDFYKINERQVLDDIMPKTTKVKGLVQIMEQQGLDGNAKRMYGGLIEWAKIQSLNPHSAGLSIEKCLLNNAVVYIKGSLDDKVIRDATRILIMEIIQEANRLEKKRDNHLTLVIDELRFLTSNAVVDATATFAGFNANMILAYQSVKDIRNLEDRNIDALAAETSINTNCQLKFIYGSQDVETCEWAEKMSGELQKRVTQRETTQIGYFGEESWENQRVVGEKQEAFITRNTMLSLEKRAGILFLPSQLPKIVFTCFVPVERNKTINF